jgi:hypothetical protein
MSYFDYDSKEWKSGVRPRPGVAEEKAAAAAEGPRPSRLSRAISTEKEAIAERKAAKPKFVDPRKVREEAVGEAEVVAKQEDFDEAMSGLIPSGASNVSVVAGRAGDGAGGGGPIQTGTRTTTTTAPNLADPQGFLDQYGGALDFESRAVAAQGDAAAAGLGIRANLYQDLMIDQQEEVFTILQEAHKIFDDANRQMVGVQELADDVRANRINPGQFFANLGEAGTFAASMAVAAGHLAASMGGGPNTALSVINGAIERNMRAQALNQAHDRAALNTQLQIFDRMRALGIDRLNQANVYNGLLLSHAQSGLEAAAAATASIEMRAQIGIVLAQLSQKRLEVEMRVAGSIQSTAQMRLFGLAGAAQQSAAQNVVPAVVKFANKRLETGKAAGLSDEDIQRETLSLVMGQMGTTDFTDDQINQLLATPAFHGVDPSRLRQPKESEVINFTDPTTGENLRGIPSQEFLGLPKAEQAKKRDQFRANAKVLRIVSEMVRLVHENDVIATSGDQSIGKYLRAESGRIRFVGGSGPQAEASKKLAIRINNYVSGKEVLEKGKVEAIHGPGEQTVKKAYAGVPTTAETVMTALNDGSLNDLFIPLLETIKDDFRDDWRALIPNIR